MTDLTHAYCDITKAERNAEGDLVVTGRATGPDVDLDRQICDPAWLAKAMPEWYSTGANVREMHTSIAAGRGDELVQNGDGWDLRSIVVDPVSARKVEKQVLRGYSIGIRNPQVIKDVKAPGGRIVGGQIVEVSLVDRPANPSCQLVLAKALKPGPQATGAIDAERRLVKVEELRDRSAEPQRALEKALKGFDLVAVKKGDQAGDIANAQQAIAIIAGLIQAEAASLADGVTSESCDIDLLLSAVKSLEWFIQRETEEPAVAHVALSADADTPTTGPDATKADELAKAKKPAPVADDEAADEADESDAEEADEDAAPKKKATGKAATPETPDLTELVKAAVAEAIAPLQERLAKAEAAPQAGGPVLTRTVQDIQKASNREALLTAANQFQATADSLTGTSRASYLAKAAELRRQANTS